MLYSCQSGISAKVFSLVPAIWVASTCAFLINPSTAVAADPLPARTAQWTFGPTNVSVGPVAELSLERGCRFTDADGARLELNQIRSPIPRGILGLMRTEAGGLYMLLSFEALGYVQDTDGDVNSAAVLEGWCEARRKYLARGEVLTNVDWRIKPTRNAAQHAWDYALSGEIQAGNNTSQFSYHARRLLTRSGVLTITVISRVHILQQDFEHLAQTVSLKNGQAYAAATENEKTGKLSAVELLARSDWEAPSEAATSSKKAMQSIILYGLGIAVLVAAFSVALVLALRKIRRPRFLAASRAAKGQAEEAMSSVTASASSAAVPDRSGFKPKLTPTPLSPKESKESKDRNGRRAMKPVLGHNGAHKKREFDYNRYFTDLMSAVSSHGLALEQAQQRIENYSLAMSTMAPQVLNANGAQSPAGNGNSDLIANQAAFIEDQRRLIQEQSRLIEEKTRLIAEKNALLKLQSEMLENKVL